MLAIQPRAESAAPSPTGRSAKCSVLPLVWTVSPRWTTGTGAAVTQTRAGRPLAGSPCSTGNSIVNDCRWPVSFGTLTTTPDGAPWITRPIWVGGGSVSALQAPTITAAKATAQMAQRGRRGETASKTTARSATSMAPRQPIATPINVADPATMPVMNRSSPAREFRRSLGLRCPPRGSGRRRSDTGHAARDTR